MSTAEHLDRYALDPSRPAGASARSDLLRRVLLPALGVWLVVVGVGTLITGPLGELPGEETLNEALQAQRTPLLDTLTQVWSNIGGTHTIVLACAALIALLWWRTRQWWLAVVPGLAASVQSAVFLTSSLVVGRERPEVEQIDHSPPTTSFPSGHTGASTAFYLTCLVLARRIPNPALRWAVMVLCAAVPLLVAFSRLYRGMHHTTDVVVGLLNGVVCAFLAWHWLRRDTPTPTPPRPPSP